jgi:hypothetical protein
MSEYDRTYHQANKEGEQLDRDALARAGFVNGLSTNVAGQAETRAEDGPRPSSKTPGNTDSPAPTVTCSQGHYSS